MLLLLTSVCFLILSEEYLTFSGHRSNNMNLCMRHKKIYGVTRVDISSKTVSPFWSVFAEGGGGKVALDPGWQNCF